MWLTLSGDAVQYFAQSCSNCQWPVVCHAQCCNECNAAAGHAAAAAGAAATSCHVFQKQLWHSCHAWLAISCDHYTYTRQDLSAAVLQQQHSIAGAQGATMSQGLAATYLELSSRGAFEESTLSDRACAAAALRCVLAFNSAAKVPPHHACSDNRTAEPVYVLYLCCPAMTVWSKTGVFNCNSRCNELRCVLLASGGPA